MGRVVMVTGASSGIGEALAFALGSRGDHLVLVARRAAPLEGLARRIRDAGGSATVVVVDLSKPGAARATFDEVERRGLELDVLVNNAGVGYFGAFHDEPVARLAEELQVNVVALAELTRLFVPALLARRGKVLNVASAAAFQPAPFMSSYGATKAFVLSFTEALWAEYRDSGLMVTAVCPGPVETAFIDGAGSGVRSTSIFRRTSSVDDVVRTSLRALDGSSPTHVVGFRTWLMSLGPRFSPRALTARLSARLLRPAPSARALLAPGVR